MVHVIMFTNEEWELIRSLPDSGLGQCLQDGDKGVALGERILEQKILEVCWRNQGSKDAPRDFSDEIEELNKKA